MKIAQVAPLYESVPPGLYGGTERIVSYLTEELVRQGHAVTLFASGDSRTAAELVPGAPRALRLDPERRDALAHHLVMLERVFARAEEFDVVHFHCDYLHFPFSRRHAVAGLTTLHGRLDLPDLQPIYREYREMPLVSISEHQRRPIDWARWIGTVHHGVPRDLYRFSPGSKRDLVFLGRISVEKRVDRAIEIARRFGARLRIAAKIDPADRDYYEEVVRPLLDSPDVEFLGEVDENEKQELLGDALALLFPIDWPEPFGLAMIESMACGTPVVAWRNGSIPEIVDEGVTGHVVDTIDGAVRALERIESLDRAACRRRFEERFSAERMARDYLSHYARVMATPRAAVGATLGGRA